MPRRPDGVEGQVGVERRLDQCGGGWPESPGVRQPQPRDGVRVCGQHRLRRRPLRFRRTSRASDENARHHRGDLARIADQHDLRAEWSETSPDRHTSSAKTHRRPGRQPCNLARSSTTSVRWWPPRCRARFGAGNTLQVRSTPVEALGPLRLARTEQANPSTDSGCATGHVERLRAGLGRNRNLRLRTTVQLFGQVDHQPGFSGAWRRRHDYRRITRPGRKKRGRNGGVGWYRLVDCGTGCNASGVESRRRRQYSVCA